MSGESPAVEQPQPQTTETTQTIQPPQAESGSLADHESQFGAEDGGSRRAVSPSPDDESGASSDSDGGRDARGRFAPRHRAASSQAGAEDGAEIQTLTAELRTREAELAKLNPAGGKESPRVLNLKRQIKGIQAEISERTPKAETVPAQTTPAALPPVQTGEKKAFDKPRPKFEAFADKGEDALDSYWDAVADWNAEKREFERSQRDAETKATADEHQLLDGFVKDLAEFGKTTPDFEAARKALFDTFLPPVLLNAVVRHDKRGQVVYYLGQHQDALDALVMETSGKPLDANLVAIVQRRLSGLVGKAAGTGSVAPPKVQYQPPPSPPNPVRTGPSSSGDEPPGDDAPLSAHEKAYHRRKD